MSFVQTETLLEDLNILLIANPGELADMVKKFYQDQQIDVDFIPLDQNQVLESLQQLGKDDVLGNYYKIVTVFDFFSLKPENVQLCKDTINILQEIKTSQLFLLSVTSKVNATSPLFEEWKQQTACEDELISYLYKAPFSKKIILGQDLIDLSNDLGVLSYPIKFLIQAIPNGYLLNPGQDFYPQFVDDFFNAISKELIKSDGYNFLVKGGAVTTDEICDEITLIYQSIYQKKLETLSIEALGQSRLEKKPDFVEVSLEKMNLDRLCSLASQTSLQNLGVDPSLLDELLDKNQPMFKTSMVITNPDLRESLDDFEIEKSSVLQNKPVQEMSLKSRQPRSEGWICFDQDENKSEEKEQAQFSKKIKKTNSSSSKKENEISPSTLSTQASQNISKIFSKSRVKQKTERRSIKAVLIDRIKKKSKRKKAVFAGGFVLLVLGISLAVLVATLSASFRQSQGVLENNIDSFLQGNISVIKPINDNFSKKTNFLDRFLDIHLIQKSRDLNRVNSQLIELAHEIEKSRQTSSALFDYVLLNMGDLAKTTRGTSDLEKQNSDSQNDINQLLKQKEISDKLLFEKLSLFYADIDELPLNNFSMEIDNKFSKTLSELKDLMSANLVAQQINQILPNLLGINHKQVVYFLLQDERELRPTGGFIEAVGMMVVEDGKVIDWQVFSSSQIDNKILGKITAPPEVKTFLGEENLFFRDANWDPDFYSTSQRLSWFIKESLNQPVDAIVAINYGLLKDILAITGDVKIDGQVEAINSWNLYNRLEMSLAEQKNQSSSENFQAALLNAVFQRLPYLDDAQKTEFFNTVFRSFEDQQALLYLSDSDLNNIAGQLGWSGSLVQPECPTGFGEACLSDNIYQVESNIGVNKVNPYINQSVIHSIEIEENKIKHQRKIKYVNKARSNIWPLGTYKFYLRFYVNPESSLEKIVVNGNAVEEDKVLNYIDHDRKVFGLVSEVLVGQELEIELFYSTPLQVKPGQSYFFFDQLQPGLKKRPLVISLKHPSSLEAVRISPQADVNNNQLVVTSDVGSGFVIVQFEN